MLAKGICSKRFFLLLMVSFLIGLSFGRTEEKSSSNHVPRLFRVILPVSDMAKAVKYYTELLGIQGQQVSPGRHYFSCGGVILALVNPRADGDPWDARANQDHIYFAVSDLEAVYERAVRVGGLATKIDHGMAMGKIEKRPWGERSFYLKDPFGNPLCFVDEKTLFTGR
ncbi:VOC family protein [bacterium]|nr:VOC family protein [bacterium]MCI0605382.1 VOC family protein [bacterium]